MVTFIKAFRQRERLGVSLIRAGLVILVLASLGSVQAADRGKIIVLQLKNDLSELRQQSATDPGVKRSLDALRKMASDIESLLTQQAKDPTGRDAPYADAQTFTMDVSAKPQAQQKVLLDRALNNPLVTSAYMETIEANVEKDSGSPIKAGLGARSEAGLDALYKKGPVANPGYVLGGINSDAVRMLPGSQGENARVVIASDGFWNRSHVDLPSLAFSPIDGPRRLSCSTYYAVSNDATAAAGIIAAKDNQSGVVGIVPHAQLAATAASFASIYDLQKLNLRAGDVLVVDPTFSPTTTRFADFSPYPGDVCPKASPTAVSTDTCQLPSAGYENTQRSIEYLTQELKVHVIVNASGGIKSSRNPATPMNLDHPDFNGLFDRTRNDDGAIYVGSVNPKTGATLAANYGSRIDLTTWATHIPYASYTAGGTHATYSRYDSDEALNYRFSGYIVAGAVAQIQSIAFAKGLGAVPPSIMRRLLKETGHDLPGHDANQPMGKQPDVKAAVDKMLAEYARGFPAEPAPAFGIKRILGLERPYYGRTWNYRAIMNPPGATDVTYQWSEVESPLVAQTAIRVNPLTLDVDWSSGLKARERTITLTARNSQGATDTWSKRLTVPPMVTRYTGTWNVPDELKPGQVVSMNGRIQDAFATGQKIHYYWKAPALFHGLKEGTAVLPAQHAISFTVPATLEPGTQVQVQMLATVDPLLPPTQISRSQHGTLLSKMVTIKTQTPVEGTPGEDAEACAPLWNSRTLYETLGTRVSYAGFNYEVVELTQGHQPDAHFTLTSSFKPWKRIGPCRQ